MTPIWFALAAGLGAVARHGVNALSLGWVGTLVVNVTGAFALGLLIGLDVSAPVATVLGSGLLGSFTTFSTFAIEASHGPIRRRLLVVASTLILGMGAAALGFAVA